MKHYRQNHLKAFSKTVGFTTDVLRWTLHTSTYVPNQDTDVFFSAATNELATGGGYTASTAGGGGLAIASPTVVYTPANSWATTRANSTAYNVDDVIRPAAANGFLYRVAVAGTTAAAPPAFSTVLGRETADGTAVLETVGVGVTVFGCTDPQWAAAFSAGPFRYAVLSDATPGSAATNILLGYVDFGVDKTGGGGTFTVNLHPQLRALHHFAV